jgi:hypothetical protein
VFMTILSAGDTLAAGDRALTIYPEKRRPPLSAHIC